MHLKNVTLRNFRCFENFNLDLHPRLTVLVAENGGGKTSILDGISIGLSSVLHYLSSANQRLSGPSIKDTDFRLESWEGRGGAERWGASDYAQVIIETMSGLKWDNWRASAKGKQRESKIGQNDLAAYALDILNSLKTSAPKTLPVFAYYGAKRGWLPIPERIRDSKVNYEYPTSALFQALKSLTDFKELLKWFDLEEASELRANKGRDSEGYDESSALHEVRSAISSLLGGKYSHPGFNKKHKFVIQSDTTPSELQVSQLSQGYQSMLALGMDFARRLALGNPYMQHFGEGAEWEQIASEYVKRWMPDQDDIADIGPAWAPAIMLVDEIDVHLHPSWQQRVLGDLMRAFPCTQFIVTSHSPQVLSTVPMESIRIIKDEKVYQAPPGTDGAEAQRILEDVFHVSPRPKTPMSSFLEEYLRLVDARDWNSPRALELRQKLDSWSQGQEPRLLEADLQIDNMKWEAGQ